MRVKPFFRVLLCTVKYTRIMVLAQHTRAVAGAIYDDIAQGMYAPGTPLPSVRGLATRYKTDETTAADACSHLASQDKISLISTVYFAGEPSVILAPGFVRPKQLKRLLGEYFSFRAEEPDAPIHIKTHHNAFDARATRFHTHDFCELTIVDKGEGFHIHNANRYPIRQGDCFVVLPGEEHGYRTLSSMNLIDIIFYPDLLEPLSAYLEQLPGFAHFFSMGPLRRNLSGFGDKLHLDTAAQSRFCRIVQEMESELEQLTKGCHVAVLCKLFELVTFLSRYEAGSAAATPHRQDRLQTAQSYIKERLSLPITPDDIARFTYLSPSRLHHLFREKLDCSVMEYVKQIRLNHACDLLAHGSQPIAAIAAACGFVHPAQFTRAFSSHFGYSPRMYRKKQVS